MFNGGSKNFSFNLPAAFLKEKNILPRLDIKTNWQYDWSFDKLVKNGKTVDELFINKTPTLPEMLNYCRNLFYEDMDKDAPNKSALISFTTQINNFTDFF